MNEDKNEEKIVETETAQIAWHQMTEEQRREAVIVALPGEVVEIDSMRPHKTSEVICVRCYQRWIAVRPEDARLADLECPACHRQKYTIETGETR